MPTANILNTIHYVGGGNTPITPPHNQINRKRNTKPITSIQPAVHFFVVLNIGEPQLGHVSARWLMLAPHSLHATVVPISFTPLVNYSISPSSRDNADGR